MGWMAAARAQGNISVNVQGGSIPTSKRVWDIDAMKEDEE